MIKPIKQLIDEALHLAALAKTRDSSYFKKMDDYDHLEQSWEIPTPLAETSKQAINLAIEHIITLEQNLSYFDDYFMGAVDKDSDIVRTCDIWLISSQADEISRFATYLEATIAEYDECTSYHYSYGARSDDNTEQAQETYLNILKQQLLAIRTNLEHCGDTEKDNNEIIATLREAEHAVSCINQTLEFYYDTEKQPYSNIHFGLIQVENLLISIKEEYLFFEASTHEHLNSKKYILVRRLIDDTLKQF